MRRHSPIRRGPNPLRRQAQLRQRTPSRDSSPASPQATHRAGHRGGVRGSTLERQRHRAAARRRRQFDGPLEGWSYRDWIVGRPCCINGVTSPGGSHPHHVKTRGAGGWWFHLVPLCHELHEEVHRRGAKTFWSETSGAMFAARNQLRCWIQHLASGRAVPDRLMLLAKTLGRRLFDDPGVEPEFAAALKEILACDTAGGAA